MENAERGIKRRSRLAVFEHVGERKKNPKKKKFRPNRLELDDSSPSESELVIDDEKEPVKNKKNPLIRLTEERLNLYCEWCFCDKQFDSWEKFNTHIVDHASVESENLICRWGNCTVSCDSDALLIQHVSYHGYLSKLKNIGQNVLDRSTWPDCKQKEDHKIPLSPDGYTCRWEYCSFTFYTIFDFFSHIELHVHNNPRVSKKASKEVITCRWQGCNLNFSSKYKLAEHLRTHTKEKVVACPTCCTTFANKTKLGDHRKRQLSSDLQSYQCSQCLKLFPSERLLRDHMRSHINHYKCTMCDMTCPKPSILAKHIRFKHIKEKPFKCPSCPKSFVAKHNLNTHLSVHARKGMKCDLCDYECRTKKALDNHYVKVHEKERAVFQCHCCKSKFRRGDYLTKHLMKIHNYHWPSGHSRFRYRKDQDGVHRLQTVRYESLEVTQEMLRSESMQSSNTAQNVDYKIRCKSDGKSNYIVSVSEDAEDSVDTADVRNENILITINDIDEHGNIVRTEVLESGTMSESVVEQKIEIKDDPFGCLAEEIKVQRAGVKLKQKRGRKRKRKNKVEKSKKGRSMPIMDEEEDFRYFPKHVILNSDKFEIKTPT